MRIILNHPHTHAGQLHVTGVELDVSQRDAEWLVTVGVANFKPGVHERQTNNLSAVRGATPMAGSPAIVRADDTDHPPTDETGDTHE